MTDNEIVKALEYEASEKICIHEQYEEACGLWCKHLHKWCADMGGKNEKNNCSAFKPTTPTKKAKATLDLINRLKAEIETKDTIIANQGIIIEELLTNMGKIATEAYKEFAERLIEERLAIVLLKSVSDEFALGYKTALIDVEEKTNNLLKELVGDEK